MDGLRSEFGGPKFEPHVTVVGAIALTEDDAVGKFRAACEGLSAYTATVDRVATGTFFYQCVYLLLRPTAEVIETSDHCSAHLGYKRPTWTGTPNSASSLSEALTTAVQCLQSHFLLRENWRQKCCSPIPWLILVGHWQCRHEGLPASPWH
ncbi:hypothetical protein BT93_E2055 [Corymbia citriodora subsp. variegata]|nr:hypothetical protein BT93_E2055 [Corymbia citriodora subsp. variegata]